MIALNRLGQFDARQGLCRFCGHVELHETHCSVPDRAAVRETGITKRVSCHTFRSGVGDVDLVAGALTVPSGVCHADGKPFTQSATEASPAPSLGR
jgi:hypothetical protein